MTGRGAARAGRCYDAAVIGGGPAGATVATLLARGGLSVLLCDAARFPRPKVCGEYVPPAALRVLADLGALEPVLRLSPRWQVGMAIVAPGGTRVLGSYGDPDVRGFSIRRLEFDHALFEHARASGASTLEGHRLVDFERRSDGLFDLELAPTGPGLSGTEAGTAHPGGAGRAAARARVIVGADGRNSLVARRLGLRRPEPRHRRWAVMGHYRDVQTPADHGEMIVTSYGYCGINPLPGGLANVCMVVDPRRACGALPGRAGLRGFFEARLTSHPSTRRAMAGARPAGPLRTIGPMACRTARPVCDGALLVGDAAGFYDPFTGEGIAMALRGGVMAAEVLRAALLRGDVTAAALARYATERRRAFAARQVFDQALQAILARPRLTEWVAGRLQRDQRLADLLARVAGDLVAASQMLRPGVVARFMLA